MSLANSQTQRARFIAKVAQIQLELADLMLELDATMAGRPAPEVIKALARADVHVERASTELTAVASAIGGIQ